MRHIMTAREFADHSACCEHHTVEDYNMAEQIAQAIESIKDNPDAPTSLATMERTEMAAAIGELLTLLAMHELAQEQREGAFDES